MGLARTMELVRRIWLYLGVSVSTISHYEAETHLPDVFTCKISDYFGVSTDFAWSH